MVAPTGKAQVELDKYIQKAKKSGQSKISLTDLARKPEFRGIHWNKMYSAAQALKKKELIKDFDGTNIVIEIRLASMESKNLKDFFLIEAGPESVVPALRGVSDRERSGTIVFSDGSKLKVTVSTSKIILASYNALRGGQKRKFEDLISKRKANFERTLNVLYRSLTKERR